MRKSNTFLNCGRVTKPDDGQGREPNTGDRATRRKHIMRFNMPTD